jgi:hypothetical protein
MNLARVEQIAKAILYEGYMLYPYRPSSVKNRQRWNFGVVYPHGHNDRLEGADTCTMQSECLIRGDQNSVLQARLRFLHLRARLQHPPSSPAFSLPDGWQEAIEREVAIPDRTLEALGQRTFRLTFNFPPAHTEEHRQAALQGTIEIFAVRLREDLFKIAITVRNNTPVDGASPNRDEALMRSLVSAHLVLGAERAAFVSLLDLPEDLRQFAGSCQNQGWWPVLVGDPGQCDTLLASPIILYDYPQIAPESVGDLFDGTEIDEILSLRILTLTDEEKREIRQSDERARQILERTESMPEEQFMKLHGAVRGLRPVKESRP